MNTVMSSSRTAMWETPPALFGRIDRVFHMSLDVCATPRNAKTPIYFTEEFDALQPGLSWAFHFGPYPDRTIAWMNPPYGRQIGKWVERAYAMWKEGGNLIALLPARTDTAWFQGYVFAAPSLLFLRQRVPFLLPCHICGTASDMLYGSASHAWPAYAKLPDDGNFFPPGVRDDNLPPGTDSVPLCGDHAPADWPRRWRSVAPFPSAIAFFLQRHTLEGCGSLAYHFGDMGKIR